MAQLYSRPCATGSVICPEPILLIGYLRLGFAFVPWTLSTSGGREKEASHGYYLMLVEKMYYTHSCSILASLISICGITGFYN
ncbi:hypothetical protein GGR56DRAFT_619951 [Xylariaceae sp. FL0804]|nr:hypothetical protein GGR56DRAFT_619951 [Xylariaceae sp. FL0804]